MNQEEIYATMRECGRAFRADLIKRYEAHGLTEADIEFPPMYVDGVDATQSHDGIHPYTASRRAKEEEYTDQWLIGILLNKINAQQRTIRAQQIDGTAKLESLRKANARIKELTEDPEGITVIKFDTKLDKWVEKRISRSKMMEFGESFDAS